MNLCAPSLELWKSKISSSTESTIVKGLAALAGAAIVWKMWNACVDLLHFSFANENSIPTNSIFRFFEDILQEM